MYSPMVFEPLTKLQCCPTSDGSAAAVLVSERFLKDRPELRGQAILIAGQCMATDSPAIFNHSSMSLVGMDMTKYAARRAMAEAQVSIKDIGVCELHDCFSSSEMIAIDGLGFSEPGKAHKFVRAGEITYGGSVVINPSGGLISKGHPLGATGLAQCAELVWQLRGWANSRLVQNVRVALAHNVGLGGAIVVTVYKRADGGNNTSVSDEDVRERSGVGYNPAVEIRGFTTAQAKAVRSKRGSDWAFAGSQGTHGPLL
jgi:sterol carrier protein 2